MRQTLSRIAWLLSCSIVAKGILVALHSSDIHPEQWIAQFLGLAEVAIAQRGIAWILIGITAILGLVFGPTMTEWIRRTLANRGTTPQSPSLREETKELASDLRNFAEAVPNPSDRALIAGMEERDPYVKAMRIYERELSPRIQQIGTRIEQYGIDITELEDLIIEIANPWSMKAMADCLERYSRLLLDHRM